MSITDELREYANIETDRDIYAGARLYKIADRIDAEHEADVSTACRLAAGLDNDALAKRGYIALPMDADGVPIHVGDMVEDAGVREIVKRVMQIRYTLGTSSKPPIVLTSIITDASQLPQKPNSYRHHHAPTVEDVLREFGISWEYESDCEDRAALLKEYAAKLRLAEEVDE